MRDIALVLIFAPMFFYAMRYLHTSTMLWVWTALAAPSSFLYGFAATLPLNKIAVGATVLAMVADRTKKKFVADGSFTFHTLLLLQSVISFGVGLTDIQRTYDLLDRMSKIFVLSCFMRIANRSRLAIHCMVIIFTLSVGLHGILEGFKYILSAGSHKVQASSVMGDNNSLALNVLMVLPFFFYLFQYTRSKLVGLGFLFLGVLGFVGVIATASRGGLIGIVVLAIMFIWQSKRKGLGILVVIVMAVTLVSLAPDKWVQRMDTIKTAENDDSFMSRVASWKMHTIMALDRPLTGGGFSALEDARVYNIYRPQFGILDFIPSEPPVGVLAAHSIYFEVLGDLGFSGLFLYLALLTSWMLNIHRTKVATKGDPEHAWAYDLAIAFQRSITVFLISGAALSMAYFEIIYVQLTMCSVLRRAVDELLLARARATASAEPRATPLVPAMAAYARH